jgi:hypothetical protein
MHKLLDAAIPSAKSAEKRAAKPTIADAQRRLSELRERFRELRCY